MDINKIIADFAKAHNIKLKILKITDFIAYEIDKSNLSLLLQFFKNDSTLRFTMFTDLFAADFPSNRKRFEIIYNLLSFKLNKRLILKVYLSESESITSVTNIFSAACWYEREIFDMFGVIFDNSSDMRRILTDYGFKGHPLRKDFPLTGHLQIKYDDKLEKIINEPVLLEQEFRSFDLSSPWNGPNGYLPGDEKAKKC